MFVFKKWVINFKNNNYWVSSIRSDKRNRWFKMIMYINLIVKVVDIELKGFRYEVVGIIIW
jgi:hypothetical protein